MKLLHGLILHDKVYTYSTKAITYLVRMCLKNRKIENIHMILEFTIHFNDKCTFYKYMGEQFS